MTPNQDPEPNAPRETVKHRRGSFDETDTFGSAKKSEPPPPGSLAAWLAKSQKAAAAPAPPLPRSTRKNLKRSGDQWWISCDPLAPIPLGNEPATITIGRSTNADVVLPHSQVSRIHGKIKVQGPGSYTYEDNKSSNGSIVNGEKATSAVLKVGDVITLGPYEIVIHSAESLQAQTKDYSTDTDHGGHTQVMAPKQQAAMSGLLNEVPITEILQGLEFNRKTGTLEVRCRQGKGRLTVCEGHPIQASFGDLQHDEALVEIAVQREGSFEFSGQVEPGEPSFRATITALLLEAARRMDEG